MAFRIAAASTDGININEHFGSAAYFIIFNVNDDGSYENIEKREIILEGNETEDICQDSANSVVCGAGSCGKQSSGGCGSRHSDQRIQAKINLISDCRCLLCVKCGPGAERQLEMKAITTFQINIPLEEALEIIISYYTKIDNHISKA